jgi:hypothetical protein
MEAAGRICKIELKRKIEGIGIEWPTICIIIEIINE